MTKTIDAKGHARTSTYTANSRATAFNDSGSATGAAWAYGWSGDDNLVSITLPTGGQATASYGDSINEHFPTGVRDYATDPGDPDTWAYDYDNDGNLIEAENTSAGVTYRYCYDADGLLQRIDAPPVTVALDTSLTAGCGIANQGTDTLFSYNNAGELVEIDRPGPHGTTTFSYDPVSRVRTITDGRGVEATYVYNATDHVTGINYDDPNGQTPGIGVIRYRYDANGNRVDREDATGDSDFVYDELNRLVSQTVPDPAEQTDYSYDLAGNLLELDPVGQTGIAYTYDNVNRATSVTDPAGRTTSFGYNDRDLRTSTTYPNGVTQRAAWDDTGRLACIYGHTGTAPSTGTDGCPAPSTSLLNRPGFIGGLVV